MGEETDFGVLTASEMAELLAPRQLLFVSVDVVGSTVRKHEEREDKERKTEWPLKISSFLTTFVAEMAAAPAIRRKSYDLQPMRLWKTIGDEVVLVVQLNTAWEAAAHIDMLRDVLNGLDRKDSEDGPHWQGYPVKATAWVASVPSGSVIVPLPLNLDGRLPKAAEVEKFDYVGPQMDFGFRIAKLSTHRMMSLSPELTWLMLSGRDHKVFEGKFSVLFPLVYSGRHLLKGIFLGSIHGCPNVWLELFEEGRNEKEVKVMNRGADMLEPLREFCEETLLDHGHPKLLPFFELGPDGLPPPEFRPEGDDGSEYREAITMAEQALQEVCKSQRDRIGREKAPRSKRNKTRLESFKRMIVDPDFDPDAFEPA